jgi:hypothetical protein
MAELSFTLKAEWFKMAEDRDERLNPAMTSWNSVAECFGVRSGGDEGWPNGNAIVEKAVENIASFPESLATKFRVQLDLYRANKLHPLPYACGLVDEIRKYINYDRRNVLDVLIKINLCNIVLILANADQKRVTLSSSRNIPTFHQNRNAEHLVTLNQLFRFRMSLAPTLQLMGLITCSFLWKLTQLTVQAYDASDT